MQLDTLDRTRRGEVIGALLFNRYTLAAALLAGAGYAIYRGVAEIRDAGEAAQEARDEARALRDGITQRDALIERLRAEIASERERAAEAAAALARKQEELRASNEALAIALEAYRDDLEAAPAPERACADSRVPAAVDRLLGGVRPDSGAAPAGAGGRDG